MGRSLCFIRNENNNLEVIFVIINLEKEMLKLPTIKENLREMGDSL